MAKDFVERARERVGRLSAALIGSYARGDFNEWSDIDVLLVAERVDENPLRRWDRLIDILVEYPEIEPIILSRAEFMRQLRLGTPMILELVEKGVILADDLGILEELRRGRGLRQ